MVETDDAIGLNCIWEKNSKKTYFAKTTMTLKKKGVKKIPKTKGKTSSDASIEETSEITISSTHHEPEMKSQDSISQTNAGNDESSSVKTEAESDFLQGVLCSTTPKDTHTNHFLDAFDAAPVITAGSEHKSSKIEETTEGSKSLQKDKAMPEEDPIEPMIQKESISHSTGSSAMNVSHEENKNLDSPTKALLSLTDTVDAVEKADVCAQNDTKMAKNGSHVHDEGSEKLAANRNCENAAEESSCRMTILHEIRDKVEKILGDKKEAELFFKQEVDEGIKKLASNQGDVRSLVYSTVCLQVIQDNTKLGGKLDQLLAEVENHRAAYLDATAERDILKDKLEQTLSTLEHPDAACVVCMAEVGRNVRTKKGKVTGVDEDCRALCKAHSPSAKEFIKNTELKKILHNTYKNEMKQLRFDLKAAKEEADLQKNKCGALAKLNKDLAAKEAEYERLIETQKTEIDTQASALSGVASNEKTEDETSASAVVNQLMEPLKIALAAVTEKTEKVENLAAQMKQQQEILNDQSQPLSFNKPPEQTTRNDNGGTHKPNRELSNISALLQGLQERIAFLGPRDELLPEGQRQYPKRLREENQEPIRGNPFASPTYDGPPPMKRTVQSSRYRNEGRHGHLSAMEGPWRGGSMNHEREAHAPWDDLRGEHDDPGLFYEDDSRSPYPVERTHRGRVSGSQYRTVRRGHSGDRYYDSGF